MLLLQIKVSYFLQKIPEFSLNELLKIRLKITNDIITSISDKDELSLTKRMVQGVLERGSDAIINIDF